MLIEKGIRDASKQVIDVDSSVGGYIEPFFSFDALGDLYYANTYHRRAIQIKAALLSNIEDGSKLEGQSRTAKQLLYSFIINLELFGNAFLEINLSKLYLLPSLMGRVDKEHNIYQIKSGKKIALTGRQLAYYSPKSIYYGEPDYLAALLALLTSTKIDTYNHNFFDNGARADQAIVFENSEPSTEQLESFKQFYGDNFKGFHNAHKTLVVTAGGDNAKVRFENLSKVNDLSFKELREISRDEIIAAHGVPPRMMGITHSAALGGSQELIGQLHTFNQLTIIPKQEEIEWFFDEIGFPIKLKPVDVTNFKDDSEMITALVAQGIITAAEARGILGHEGAMNGM